MRPLTIILLVVALGIAGLTAVLANRFLAQRSAASSEAASRLATASKKILVATVDLPVGHTIIESDVSWQDWPETLINARFVVRGGGEDARMRYVGSIVRSAFTALEPIQASRVFRNEGASTMSGLLAPGMQAISIDVTLATGVSGFVMPGDRVDVLVTYEVKPVPGKEGASSDGFYKFISETFLRNLRVMAADQTFTEIKNAAEASVKAKNVTLEVTDKQAEILSVARALGTLSLTLRSVARGDGGTEAPSYTSDVMVIQGLRSMLGGAKAVIEEPTPSEEKPIHRVRKAPPSVVKVYRGSNVATQSFSQ